MAIKAKLVHRCTHILDLDASLAFYRDALGLTEAHRFGPSDGSWVNVFLSNDEAPFELELTWNKGRTEPYDNGGGDTHIAVTVTDINAAHALHEQMGCIIRENAAMGLYFIVDPDGCWIEIMQS
jgi:lactoylglutathione lyase